MRMADKKGDVEYILRADDSHIESDINAANKKIKNAVEKSAEDTVNIEKKKTADIKSETDKVVSNTAKATDKIADDWKDAGTEAKQSMASIKDEDINIDIDVDADTSKAETEIKSVSKDKKAEVDVDADTSKAEQGLDDLNQMGEQLGEDLKQSFTDALSGISPITGSLTNIASGLTGTSALAAGLGTAFVGAGILSVKSASDMKSAMNDFIAQTGKGTEEIDKYQGVLEKIYANNYGEDFQDIASAMATVNKNLGDMDDVDLQNITESAFVLRDTFEYDITESTRAAKAMMDNFGVSGEEAMNLIAAGAQNGLDYSGELLDSISEYSVQFGKLGMDADDMFKIFQKGADSGAFNLDKVGDAMKEFSIRVMDGSDTTKEGFELIGLNAEEMASKFSKGGKDAREAFDETIESLAAIEDPLKRNQAGVDLFGTMWEDLGEDAVTALAEIEDGSYAVGDELEKLKEIKADDLNSMFESLGRALELVILPLGNALMPLLMTLIQTVLPIIQELLAPLLELIGAFLEPIITLIQEALQPLMEAFTLLMENAIKPLISVLQDILMPIFDAVFSQISEVVTGTIGKITSILMGLIDFVKGVFTGNWSQAWSGVQKIFGALPGPIQNIIGSIKSILNGIITFIKGVFTGNWKQAWEGLKSILSGIWSGLTGVVKAPINAIIGLINKFIGGLNKLQVPDWVPLIGGKGINIPKIPKLRVGMQYVPTDDFPALLHSGEMVLTKEEAKQLRSMGGLAAISGELSYASTVPSAQAISNRGSQEPREYQFTAIVDLDGREVARGTSKYTDAELARLNDLTKRGVR